MSMSLKNCEEVWEWFDKCFNVQNILLFDFNYEGVEVGKYG